MSINYEESLATARPGNAFSNGCEYADWRGRWCENCRNDAGYREKDTEADSVTEAYAGGCPLLTIALAAERIPGEWLPQDTGPDAYHCIMFRSDQDGGDGQEPQPQPEPPGMDGLFAQPQRRVRMLVQPSLSAVSA